MNNEMEGEIENEIGRSLLTLNDLLDLIHIVCYHIFAWIAQSYRGKNVIELEHNML